MPFNAKSGKFSANINTVTMGTGDKAVKIGGENVLPFSPLTLLWRTHRRLVLRLQTLVWRMSRTV